MKIELNENKVYFNSGSIKKEIHPFWLRERVDGEEFLDKGTQQRLFDPTNLSNEISIDTAIINEKFLEINFNDGVKSKLDIDKLALEACKKNLNIETIWADFSLQIPLPTSSFNVVIAGEVIEHLPYPEITISEVSRILKPGGLFVGSVPNSYHLKNRLRVLKGRLIDYDQTHLRAYNVMLLRQYLEKDFVVEELTSSRGKSAFLSIAWFGRDLVWRCKKK